MATEFSKIVVENAGLLVALSAALSTLGLVGVALFATDREREVAHIDEEQDRFEVAQGRQLL